MEALQSFARHRPSLRECLVELETKDAAPGRGLGEVWRRGAYFAANRDGCVWWLGDAGVESTDKVTRTPHGNTIRMADVGLSRDTCKNLSYGLKNPTVTSFQLFQ